MEEQHEPLWVPYSTPPQNAWERAWAAVKRYSFVALCALLLAGLAGLLFILPETGGLSLEDINALLTGAESPTSSEVPANPFEGTAVLSVSTQPDGAQVLLDRDTIGTTPLNRREVPAGVYILSVRKDDHVVVDTVISLRRDDAPQLSFPLRQYAEGQIAEAESPDEVPPEALSETRSDERPPTSSEPSEPPATEERQPPVEEEPQPPAEQESPPAEPETPAQTGTVRFTSTPSGASVFLNGEPVGSTPTTVSDVAAGSHTVTIRQDGYEPYRANVTVAAQQRNALHGELARQTGTLRLTSDPSGASVLIDGEAMGETPLTVPNVVAGAHTVTFQMEGYEPYSADVSVAPQQDDALHGELAQQQGTLRVLARPWGSIYIDGELRAQSTDVWYTTTLPAGQHRIRVVHPALGARERVVNVAGDQEQSVVINLNQPEEDRDVTALRDSTGR